MYVGIWNTWSTYVFYIGLHDMPFTLNRPVDEVTYETCLMVIDASLTKSNEKMKKQGCALRVALGLALRIRGRESVETPPAKCNALS